MLLLLLLLLVVVGVTLPRLMRAYPIETYCCRHHWRFYAHRTAAVFSSPSLALLMLTVQVYYHQWRFSSFSHDAKTMSICYPNWSIALESCNFY